MSYYRTANIINKADNAENILNFLNNLSNCADSMPFFLRKAFELLSDEYMFKGLLTDENIIDIANVAYNYFNSEAEDIFIDGVMHTKTVEFTKIEVYKVDAANGLRYATENEIKQGIEGLIAEYIYPAGEDTHNYINMLYWSFTGDVIFYKRAGLEIKYDDGNNIVTTLVELIVNSLDIMKSMINWVSTNDNYERAIKRLKKVAKNGGFRYTTYEKDEITEDISIKQLVHNIDRAFPRNSTNKDYRKAIALTIKTNRYEKRLTPMEISFLRSVYKTFIANKDYKKDTTNSENKELKDKCDRLLKMQYSGAIPSNHFAYTIIQTLRKYKYTRCSQKQMNIIDEAIAILDKKNEEAIKNRNQTSVITDEAIDSELALVSNAIASEDEENENASATNDSFELTKISNELASGLFEEDDE